MNKLYETQINNVRPASPKSFRPLKLIYFLNWFLMITAVLAGACLLLSDFLPLAGIHAPISASPLVFIGAAYLIFQLLNSPGWIDLIKALIVSSAFLLWGLDQLLPPGWFATVLGDLVIVLYVLDLSWMMFDRLKERKFVWTPTEQTDTAR